jgi:hypothetical protein
MLATWTGMVAALAFRCSLASLSVRVDAAAGLIGAVLGWGAHPAANLAVSAVGWHWLRLEHTQGPNIPVAISMGQPPMRDTTTPTASPTLRADCFLLWPIGVAAGGLVSCLAWAMQLAC